LTRLGKRKHNRLKNRERVKNHELDILLVSALRMLGKMHDFLPGHGSPGSREEEIGGVQSAHA
jgi:hypothetical protein